MATLHQFAQTKQWRAEVSATLANVSLNAVGSTPVAVSALPSPTAGLRAYVTDATVVYSSATIGTTVAGGSTHGVPVFANGTNWVIG